MASTYTRFRNLEKFEDRSVGWDFATILDTLDAGDVSVLTAGEDIDAYKAVRWDNSADSQVLSAQATSAEGMACGLSLAGISSASSGQVLHRGFVENDLWSWTRGDLLYLSASSPGAVVSAGTTHVASNDELLLMQPIGVAIEADTAYFDFSPIQTLQPYTLTPDHYEVTSGSATPSFKAVTGPGNAMVLTGSSATIVFTYTLPPWFRAFPSIAGVWGFRAQYIAVSTGTIDVATIYDGAGNNGTPTVSAGTSTSWTNFDMDWDEIAGVGGLTFTAGNQVSIAVTLATASVDMEINPRLRFEPRPTIFA